MGDGTVTRMLDLYRLKDGAIDPTNSMTRLLDLYRLPSGIFTPVGGGVPAEAGCDDCSGTLKFSAHFENNDDITQGIPCGCVAEGGDNTLTRTGVTYSSSQYQDGGYSLYNDGTGAHYAAVTVTDGDIIASARGTISVYIYLVANFDGEYGSDIVHFDGPGTSRVRLYGTSEATGNDIKFRHTCDGETEVSFICDANLSTGEWYLITAEWNASGATYKAKVTANSVTAYPSSGDVTAFTDSGTLYINRTDHADSPAMYLDNLKIYSDSTI